MGNNDVGLYNNSTLIPVVRQRRAHGGAATRVLAPVSGTHGLAAGSEQDASHPSPAWDDTDSSAIILLCPRGEGRA
jgi:hypothetical protein